MTLPTDAQAALRNTIEACIRSTVAARGLTDHQAHVLEWRVARVVRDQAEMAADG